MPNYKRRRKIATIISVTVLCISLLLVVGYLGKLEQDPYASVNFLYVIGLLIPGLVHTKC